MYAVVRTGGKQYRVAEGDRLRVEKLDGEIGSTVRLDEVLMVSGNTGSAIGAPLVNGAFVEATITGQGRGRKIIVFHIRRRKGFKKKQGHRQPYTELTIKTIKN